MTRTLLTGWSLWVPYRFAGKGCLLPAAHCVLRADCPLPLPGRPCSTTLGTQPPAPGVWHGVTQIASRKGAHQTYSSNRGLCPSKACIVAGPCRALCLPWGPRSPKARTPGVLVLPAATPSTPATWLRSRLALHALHPTLARVNAPPGPMVALR